MKNLKIFVIVAFAVLAVGSFLLTDKTSEAQEKAKQREPILEAVADYKTWDQVNKPEKSSLEALQADATQINFSSVMG
jgi:hypothetical protein